MSNPHGIMVCGANGSGKTTLGRELARRLGYYHMDIEDYHFQQSEIPYTIARSPEACARLMLADIEKHHSFVLTAVTGDFGAEISQFYELAVYMVAPLALRLKRIEQRASQRHGERILKGGDMYEQQARFVDFVATRSLSSIEQWLQTLACPVIRIDGTDDWRESAANIAERFYQKKV